MISKKVHILQNGGVTHLLLDISPHAKSGSSNGLWWKTVFGVWKHWLEWELQQRSTLYGGGRFDWQVKTIKTMINNEKLWKTMTKLWKQWKAMKSYEKQWNNNDKQWKPMNNNEKQRQFIGRRRKIWLTCETFRSFD